LRPAPRFADVWKNSADALLELLLQANCRTVRQWALWLLRVHHFGWLARLPVDVLLLMIDHADAEVAAFGFDMLERHMDLATVPVAAWLARLDGDDLDKLQRLSSLLESDSTRPGYRWLTR